MTPEQEAKWQKFLEWNAAKQQCNHPPARLYSWWACGDDGSRNTVLCIACCACGKVLKGAA